MGSMGPVGLECAALTVYYFWSDRAMTSTVLLRYSAVMGIWTVCLSDIKVVQYTATSVGFNRL